ncbi:MAG TPA: effector-associated domain EAD1-containing protein, partial [Chloroflexota bacterium]|nr:effector-associated domain EAD1-containing protein [Chloroflexota bacterium]
MTASARLSGADCERLNEVIARAFPTRAELAQLVRYKLDENLQAIAGGDDLAEIVFNLIGWAEAKGRVGELIEKGLEMRPGNADLEACANQLRTVASQSPALQGLLDLSQLLMRSDELVHTQIQQFARSKYISGLYVRRDIQDQLGRFHTSERELARDLKTLQVKTIARWAAALSDAVSFFSGICELVSTITDWEDTESSSTIHAHRAARKMNLDGDESHNRVPSRSQALEATTTAKEIVQAISASLETTLHHVQALSDERILGETAAHQSVVQALGVAMATLPKLMESAEDADAQSVMLISVLDEPLRLTGQLMRSLPHRPGILARYAAEDLPKQWPQVFKTLSGQSLATLASELNSSIAAFESAQRHAVIIIDRAGGGKTNLLCELALQTVKVSPTLLFFGKDNFSDHGSMIRRTTDWVAGMLSTHPDTAMMILDQLLQDRGLFLHVFIDGINESRSIPAMDTALASFLEWSSHHRLRVSISCRDIYWDFFDYDKWSQYVHHTIHNKLHQFTPSESARARDLYFAHFGIKCTLVGNAETACR